MATELQTDNCSQRRGNNQPAELLQDRHGILDCRKQASGEQRLRVRVAVGSVDFVLMFVQTRAVYRAVGSSTGYKEFVGAKDATLTGGRFLDKAGTEITATKFSPLNDFGAGDIPMCVVLAN